MTSAEQDALAKRLLGLYLAAYSDGAYEVASEYGLESHLPKVLEGAEEAGKIRLALVERAVGRYVEWLEKRADKLREEGADPVVIRAEIERFARELAEEKGDLIAAIEFAKGRLDGAGAIVNSSGQKFEWRFPHLFEAEPGHIECPVCEGVRAGSPYSTEEAAANGWPDVLHPNCDHAWVLVPVGSKTHEEERLRGKSIAS